MPCNVVFNSAVGNFPNILTFLAFTPVLFIKEISNFISFPASSFFICTNCESSLIPLIPVILYVVESCLTTNPPGEDISTSFSTVPTSIVPP